MPPLSIRAGRFDLQSAPVGYFAETPETAGYETIARREMTMASLRAIGQRTLMCFETREPLNMLDLRPHASTWPVLQSLRFSQTQMLAEDVNKSGFDGIIYRSAQQFGLDCFAVFGAPLGRLRIRWSQPLVHPKTGQLHSVVASVLAGSQIDLVP